jgi:hypothetical protein
VEYDWDADKLGFAIESMEVPDSSLLHSEVFSITDMVPGAMAIDLICRREFDLSIVEYANGKPLNEILGISYKDLKGVIQHNPDHPQLTQEQRRKTPQRFLAPFWSAATSSIPLISIPGPPPEKIIGDFIAQDRARCERMVLAEGPLLKVFCPELQWQRPHAGWSGTLSGRSSQVALKLVFAPNEKALRRAPSPKLVQVRRRSLPTEP